MQNQTPNQVQLETHCLECVAKENMEIRRITLITDAWFPQINGVVTTLSSLVKELEQQDIVIDVIQPNDFPNFPMPTYKEIRLVWNSIGLKKRLIEFAPDALHIATEGTLGWHARKLAKQLKIPFTTGYHTRYPEYVRARLPIPEKWTYALLRRFHKPAMRTLVPAPSIMQELRERDFEHLALMSRGVDSTNFNPQRAAECKSYTGLTRPIQLFVGRIAPEKNIEAFLNCQTRGTKVVIGSGPDQQRLEKAYPDVRFLGAKKGADLAAHYAAADVFVFPSITDTFGVVNIESIACGTPVAAFNVTGPKDIITAGINGYVDDNLSSAIAKALQINPEQIHRSIPEYTWPQATKQFLQALAPIKDKARLIKKL